MEFTNEQKTAIIHISQQMVNADGHPSPSEAYRIDEALKKLGITSREEQRAITESARKMARTKALSIIKNFPIDIKERVVGLLKSIMKADNEIDSKEIEQLKKIAASCDLPLKEVE